MLSGIDSEDEPDDLENDILSFFDECPESPKQPTEFAPITPPPNVRVAQSQPSAPGAQPTVHKPTWQDLLRQELKQNANPLSGSHAQRCARAKAMLGDMRSMIQETSAHNQRIKKETSYDRQKAICENHHLFLRQVDSLLTSSDPEVVGKSVARLNEIRFELLGQ
jgi:hypothetical protein